MKTHDLKRGWCALQHEDGSMTIRNDQIGEGILLPVESLRTLRRIIAKAKAQEALLVAERALVSVYGEPDGTPLSSKLGEEAIETVRSALSFRFRGYLIEKNEAGWFCDQLHLGFADTAKEIEDEVERHIAEEKEHYRDIDTPPDTPSLPERPAY
jgi:hypothetical protein